MSEVIALPVIDDIKSGGPVSTQSTEEILKEFGLTQEDLDRYDGDIDKAIKARHREAEARWNGMADESEPGVFYFPREEKPIHRPVDPHDLGDTQINPRAEYSETQQIENAALRKNAQSACSQCPGWCCISFTLWMKKSEIPKMLREKRIQTAAVLKQWDEHDQREQNHRTMMLLYHGVNYQPKPFLDEGYAERLLSEIENLEFFKDRLIRIREADNRNRNASGQFMASRRHVYRCASYDMVNWRCTEYNRRPDICKSYICGPATAGSPPRPQAMTGGHLPSVLAQVEEARQQREQSL